MASVRTRKPSAWNKAVKAAFARGATSFEAAVAAAKKTYRKKSSTGKKVSPRRRRCPNGSHRRGSRCVKN